MAGKSISKIQNVFGRIKAFRNWYTLIWPINRLLPESRVIKVSGGYGIFVRSIFGPDYVVALEMFGRDDYGLNRIKIHDFAPIIVDVGANIGAFTVLAASLYKNAKIFSFEPDKNNSEILKGNINRNHLEGRVVVSNSGVDKEGGEKVFHINKREYAHSLLPFAGKDEEAGQIRIHCITIAEIIMKEKISKIDILKLDIEGSEYEVLFGLPDECYQKIKNIVLEIHDHPVFSREKLIDFLTSKGYRVFQSGKNKTVYSALK